MALPISRTSVFMAKLMLCLLLVAVSCLLLSVGIVVLGLILGFKADLIPYVDVVRIGFMSYIAALPSHRATAVAFHG